MPDDHLRFGQLLDNADDVPFLLGSVCEECGEAAFPPADVCASCMSDKVSRERLSRRGTLYSYSTVHIPPKGWDGPYVVGYVDLDNGPRVFGHITAADPGVLAPDLRVELIIGTLPSHTPIQQPYQFVPVER